MNVILGPPGTGKTTHLMSLIDKHLEAGVLPSQIGLLTFTRKASSEAKSRAHEKFGFVPTDIPYWRTIHSLAFQQLKMSKVEMVQKPDFKELGEMIGIQISGMSVLEDELVFGMAPGDRYFFMENLSRVRKIPIEQVWEEFDDDDLNWQDMKEVCRSYHLFKEHRGLSDFTDLLTNLTDDRLPELEVLLVDEAQDLSLLQWDIIKRMAKKARHTYVAGDDDQAIYKWAGADSTTFTSIKGTYKILRQSYRLSQRVQELGQSIITRVQNRKRKTFRPTSHTGEICYASHEEDVDLSTGSWILLGRNQYQLGSLRRLREEYDNSSRIKVSTIHGIKGGEADHVLLLTDIARRTYDRMEENPDDEHRVFYVAITRARESVHIIEPRTPYYYDI